MPEITIALDCALPPVSVAVAVDGLVIGAWEQAPDEVNSGARHSDAVVMALRAIANAHAVDLSKTKSIIATNGPGSFTGLRVGLSLAQGLQAGSDATAFTIGSLEAIALSLSLRAGGERSAPFAVCIDAKRDRVFLQTFSADARPLDACRLLNVSDAKAELAPSLGAFSFAVFGSGGFLVCAERAEAADAQSWATDLLRAPAQLRLEVAKHFRPIYLRDADAKPARVAFRRV